VLGSGQWALVTGASSGLGEELARQLAARGVSLILTARSAEKLETLAAQVVSAHGVGTRVIPADLSTAAGIDALISDVARAEIAVDHLIGNAGFGTFGVFAESEPIGQRQMVVLHCEAIVALTRALLPSMIARRAGGVIHVASTAAFQPAGEFAVYAATKTFVLHFTEALHEELRGTGVRAMALCPGPVPTGFQARASFELAPAQKPMTMTAAETVRRALDAYERGDAVCVPGALNKIGSVLGQVGPRGLVRRVAHELMRVRKT
jgi:short-subunit dehydrogenase